ncbi:MAG: hypothetical protein QOJ65_640, partial [Fimbriimonadaceae bacterium]|nr:hypothetical protein [Fimbriimonadaceae bacterium]
GFWKSYMEKYKDWTDENLALHDRYFRKQLEIVGKMQKAGVPILAGTDVMNPYCFPGFSLHDELVWLTKAGLKPGEALRAATINPAIYLGIEKDFGTAERGKVADLVLLDANPLLDIRNTTKIGAVFVRGKLLRREDLDKLMPKMPAAPAASPPAALGGIADDEWP